MKIFHQIKETIEDNLFIIQSRYKKYITKKYQLKEYKKYLSRDHEAVCPNCGMWIDVDEEEQLDNAEFFGATIYVPTKAQCIRCGKWYKWESRYNFYDAINITEIENEVIR